VSPPVRSSLFDVLLRLHNFLLDSSTSLKYAHRNYAALGFGTRQSLSRNQRTAFFLTHEAYLDRVTVASVRFKSAESQVASTSS
jgi:hypothetical protein